MTSYYLFIFFSFFVPLMLSYRLSHLLRRYCIARTSSSIIPSIYKLLSEIHITGFNGEITPSNPTTSFSFLSRQRVCNSSDDACENISGSISDRVYDAIMSAHRSDQSLEQVLDSLRPQLTTEIVNDVINRLRYEEKLAFRFFTWAANQDGYTHEHKTFNDMIDILSNSIGKMKQYGVTCDILDYMKRKGKNLVPDESLIQILKTYAEKHLTYLNKFAKKKRIKPKIQPEVHSLNLLLDSLCKCSLANEAEAIFHRMKRKIVPTSETYNILFFGWCRVQNSDKGMKIIEEMINSGHNPDSLTYNAAIVGLCSNGLIEKARELFEFMRTKGSKISSPNAKTYSVMIISLAMFDRMDECFNLLGDMRGCGCLPDVSTYIGLIRGMCVAGKIDAAYKILEEMGKNGYPPDILTYNCFLKVLCNMKEQEEALRLCERMIETGCEPSVHTYNMLIMLFFEIGDSDQAFGFWHEMDRRACARTVDTYGIMIDGLFACGREEDACFVLEEVINQGIKLPYKKFDVLMTRLSDIGNLRAIHRLSEHMRRFYNVAMARRFANTQKKRSISLRRL